jgi:hypothetical protein
VGPRAGLDDMDKRKFLTLPGLEPGPLGRPARSQLQTNGGNTGRAVAQAVRRWLPTEAARVRVRAACGV